MDSSDLSDSELSDLYSFSRSASPESDMSLSEAAEEKVEERPRGEESLGEASPKAKEKKKKKKKSKLIPGVVYLSRVPPYMKPHKLKYLLSPYGRIGNVFLQPEDESVRKRRVKFGGSKKRNYTEGWVEFADKRVAKAIAMALNNAPIGGRKRNYYHDDIWNMKYLPKFRWSHLGEKRAYERAVEQQQVQLEMSQAKREIKVYMDNVGKSKEIDAIVSRKRRHREEEGEGSKEQGEEEGKEEGGAAKAVEGEEKKVVKKYQFRHKQKRIFGVMPADPSDCLAKLRKPRISDALLKQIYPQPSAS